MFFFAATGQYHSQNETPVLHHVSHLDSHRSAPNISATLPLLAWKGRRRWTAGELTEIVASLGALRTCDIARTLGVNPKALRSALRRNGISLRAIRREAKKGERLEGTGLVVRRSNVGPSATFGAAALFVLPDGACRWPLGDPAERGFAFCGAPRLGRASYCRDHLHRAFERGDGHGR
ncbi:MAG: GcrA family cell cycle regulator [Rhodomicrobium sp.]